jgi:hypothetical protein
MLLHCRTATFLLKHAQLPRHAHLLTMLVILSASITNGTLCFGHDGTIWPGQYVDALIS